MATSSLPLVQELVRNKERFQEIIHQANSQPLPPAAAKKLNAFNNNENGLYEDADTRIFVRVRPILRGETDLSPIIRRESGYRSTIFMTPKINVAKDLSVAPEIIDVDCTFGAEDPNTLVYNTVCKDLVRIALAGGSTSVLCYGQTGSGKTFTSTGFLDGITNDMFGPASAGLTICVQFVEMASGGTTDLLTGGAVKIVEDKDGVVQTLDCSSIVVESSAHFQSLVAKASSNRATKSTLRNSGSSRSHMAARFVVTAADCPWQVPGVLNLVDLAGSESTADAATHDKERINETKFINSSLMTLKECIRARGVASTSAKHVHIPYRQTSLTLLLKDSFELTVKRPTKSALVACVSPLLGDARHTQNTLRYASLVFVSPKTNVLVARDTNDPMTWDRDRALAFITKASRGRIGNPDAVLPEGDGRALLQIPEPEFVKRIVENCGLPEKSATEVYRQVWKVAVDARTAYRRAAAKTVADQRKVNNAGKNKENENQRQEMVRRATNGY